MNTFLYFSHLKLAKKGTSLKPLPWPIPVLIQDRMAILKMIKATGPRNYTDSGKVFTR